MPTLDMILWNQAVEGSGVAILPFLWKLQQWKGHIKNLHDTIPLRKSTQSKSNTAKKGQKVWKKKCAVTCKTYYILVKSCFQTADVSLKQIIFISKSTTNIFDILITIYKEIDI